MHGVELADVSKGGTLKIVDQNGGKVNVFPASDFSVVKGGHVVMIRVELFYGVHVFVDF